MLGRNAAAEIIEKNGTADLRSIVYGEGLKVKVMHPWHSSYEDVYAHPLIFVPRGLQAPEFRSMVAHSLAHHELHARGQKRIRSLNSLWSQKQEHQCREFSAWLLVPESEDLRLPYISPSEVARRYRVTEELARVRLEAVAAT